MTPAIPLVLYRCTVCGDLWTALEIRTDIMPGYPLRYLCARVMCSGTVEPEVRPTPPTARTITK